MKCNVYSHTLVDSAVQEFVDKLQSRTTKYLTGDTPTAADVCTAIWLSSLEQQVECQEWLQSLLKHEALSNMASMTKAFSGLQVTTSSDDAAALDNAVTQKLREWSIPFDVYSHVACMTADELVEHVAIPPEDSHTKNLFLKDKKHGLFLITVKPTTVVNTKALGTLLG